MCWLASIRLRPGGSGGPAASAGAGDHQFAEQVDHGIEPVGLHADVAVVVGRRGHPRLGTARLGSSVCHGGCRSHFDLGLGLGAGAIGKGCGLGDGFDLDGTVFTHKGKGGFQGVTPGLGGERRIQPEMAGLGVQ
jgi:hypothetical protein